MPEKNEPLKNKAFELDPNVSGDEGSAFWFMDVKSAVQGLLQEIDELIEWYEKNRKEDYHIFTAKRDTAFRIKNKIKKWFPDVGFGKGMKKVNQE